MQIPPKTMEASHEATTTTGASTATTSTPAACVATTSSVKLHADAAFEAGGRLEDDKYAAREQRNMLVASQPAVEVPAMGVDDWEDAVE